MTIDAARPRVLLWGGRSQGRILGEMLRESDLGTVALIFDPTLAAPLSGADAPFTNDVAVLAATMPRLSHFVVGIGAEHGQARAGTAEVLRALGLAPLSLIHGRSFIEPSAEVGPGCQAMPFALVHKFAKIGDQAILNSHATVEHECVLGHGVHVMPGATLAGRVRVGDFAVIGSNATILPDLVIGEGAFVAAGAVVTKDVPPWSLVAGCPARPVRPVVPAAHDGGALQALQSAMGRNRFQ